MSEHKRKPLSATDRRMQQLKANNPGSFGSVKLRDSGSNTQANSSTDRDANNDKDNNP